MIPFLKAGLTLALCAGLSGCFFFYIPGSFLDALAGTDGNACVSATERVGNRLTSPDGRQATIERLNGTSSRCSEPRPIMAKVAYD